MKYVLESIELTRFVSETASVRALKLLLCELRKVWLMLKLALSTLMFGFSSHVSKSLFGFEHTLLGAIMILEGWADCRYSFVVGLVDVYLIGDAILTCDYLSSLHSVCSSLIAMC